MCELMFVFYSSLPDIAKKQLFAFLLNLHLKRYQTPSFTIVFILKLVYLMLFQGINSFGMEIECNSYLPSVLHSVRNWGRKEGS